MPTVTIDQIKAKQSELERLIAQFREHAEPSPKIIEIEECTITLAPGEHYAGAALDADGQHLHHLVLLAARPDGDVKWQQAMDWVASVNGALPTLQEQALLFANCKPYLDPAWHWSCEAYQKDASYAWFCYFGSGSQGNDLKNYVGSAVAVRRI